MTNDLSLGDLNRTLPDASESEFGVLAGMLSNPGKNIEKARSSLTKESFYDPNHGTLFRCILWHHENDKPLDINTITQALRRTGQLDKIGGPAKLSEIYDFSPISAQFDFFIAEVRDTHHIREAVKSAASSLHKLLDYNGQQPASELIAACRDEFATATSDIVSSSSVKSFKDASLDHCDHMMEVTEGRLYLIPSGLPTIDKKAGGFMKHENILVSAPTKGGKTALGLQMVRASAEKGFKSRYYTAEVRSSVCAGRIIHSLSGGGSGGMSDRRGFSNEADQQYYMRGQREAQRICNEKVSFADCGGWPFEQLLTDIKGAIRSGVQQVFVDYLAKFYSSRKFGTRADELAWMSGQLTGVVQSSDCVMVILSQENDEGKIKDSRSLGCDCDMHLQISIPEDKHKIPRNDRRNVTVALARGAESGYTVPCFFDGPHFIFRQMTSQELDAEQQTRK